MAARYESMASAAVKRVTAVDGYDHKAWAKRLRDRHESGEKLSAVQIAAYREALRIKIDPEQQQEAA